MSSVDVLYEKLGSRAWRLESGKLYKIKDKDGNIVPYYPNDAQKNLHRNQWYRNVVLKARQLGFSTDIDIQALDYALFNRDVNVGIIAHNLEAARNIFRDKVKLAWDHLPKWLKDKYEVDTDSANEISFKVIDEDGVPHTSRISVSTSYRSGTLQFLHISEFGKICNRYPDRAEEIVTGAIEAVPKEGFVFIESTAEGAEGYFYDMSMQAKRLKDEGADLGTMDYKLHFYPWWENPEYVLSKPCIISDDYKNYFMRLGVKHGITLTDSQKYWYVTKSQVLDKKMFREYPSFVEEAFHTAIEGAYYEQQMTLARKQSRIGGSMAYTPELDLYIAWDLAGAGSGGDNNALWFFQVFGKEVRCVDYWEGNGMSLGEIYKYVIQERGYEPDIVFLPHDADVRESTSNMTRREFLEEFGLYVEVLEKLGVSEGIHNARLILNQTWFDTEKCVDGIRCLDNYRREWDDRRGAYKDKPYHDWASHGADAFRYLAQAVNEMTHIQNAQSMKAVKAKWF